MNRKQSAVILIGAALLVLMGLFPPWRYTVKEYARFVEPQSLLRVREFERCRCVLLDPARTGRTGQRYGYDTITSVITVQLDTRRLGLEWLVVVMTAGALVFALRTRPARSP